MAPVHDAPERNDMEALRMLLSEDLGLTDAEDPDEQADIASWA